MTEGEPRKNDKRRRYQEGIMEEESWTRNHGGGTVKKEPWRNHEECITGGIIEEVTQESPGGTQEEPGATQEAPGASQEAPRRHSGGSKETHRSPPRTPKAPLRKRSSNGSQLKCKVHLCCRFLKFMRRGGRVGVILH